MNSHGTTLKTQNIIFGKLFNMKKFLGIVVLGLFIGFNPLVIKFSYAGLLDVFKDPLEVCMDRVIKSLGGHTVYTQDAAKNVQVRNKKY